MTGSRVDPQDAMTPENLREIARLFQTESVYDPTRAIAALYAWADQIEIERARSAVVRPTRDQLKIFVHEQRYGWIGNPAVCGYVSIDSFVDALLDRFDIRDRVAVSDSQETPDQTKGR